MYTITIFPLAKLRTGTQLDKQRVAPSATFGELRTYSSFAELVEAAATNTVSLNVYSSSDKCQPGQVHRLGANFVSTNLIGIDIDANITIDQAVEKLKACGYRYGIYRSFNHSDDAQKFRIILELAEVVTDESTYKSTWESIHSSFLGLDTSCRDMARLFFHGRPGEEGIVVQAGGLVPVVRSTPTTASGSKPNRAASVDPDGFESAQSRNKLPIEVRTWVTGVDEYCEPRSPTPGERSSLFYKLANLCRERGYTKEWCDKKLGARLRNDEEYVQKYGGLHGVNDKISATLDQIFSKNARHDQPELYGLSDLYEPRSFLNTWMKARGATVKKSGELIFADAESSQTSKDAADTLLLDYSSARAAFMIKQASLPKAERVYVPKHSESLMKAALAEYVKKHREQHILKLRERLKHDSFVDSSPSELQKFVSAICGKEDPVVEAVMRHFVWQVKRKMFGYSTAHEIMPILTGVQGNGKSTAVKQLLKPLTNFIATPALCELQDKRHFQSYRDNLIVFCDEMQGAGRADVDGLKNFITATWQTARELYTTTMVEFKQNCTPIGCSNKRLASLIYDPTGMRRFYEINTDPHMEANGCRNIINSIDYDKLWRQVDENIPGDQCPYLSKKDEIGAAQEQLRTPDPVEAFIIETGAAVVDPDKVRFEKKGDVYAAYRLFCNRKGHKYKDSTHFAKEMIGKGIAKSRRTINNRLEHVWVVSDSYHGPIEG